MRSRRSASSAGSGVTAAAALERFLCRDSKSELEARFAGISSVSSKLVHRFLKWRARSTALCTEDPVTFGNFGEFTFGCYPYIDAQG